MSLILIGFMGTGKSTIALQLSEKLKMPIMEMDKRIVQKEQMEISEIFAIKGENYFREIETSVLKELQMEDHMIVSCGGGTPLRECNVIEMRKNGPVFLLTAKPETIWERVKTSKERPLLNKDMSLEHIRILMKEREEKYLKSADYIIETDGKKPEEICQEIINTIREECVNV